ncbi:RING-H2 finger protein ATL2 [Momordica charantia]|uniref:RING-type E3 ubiquitin transferase n=1 Tax=Momordica charantia TaxID=3673 RepID=A0A6J1CBD8_MOMCH|nr:RING-H2 finger protein ATL2 [Momordica charantia]
MDAVSIGDATSPPGFNDFALSGKIMLSAIIILLFVVILIICLHLYARWYVLRARRRGLQPGRRRNRLIFYFEPENPAAAPVLAQRRGLDASVLNSLPVFTFTSESHPDPIDCAVCLSEFEENEKGRTLPKCAHSFHIDCIDMWFHSHATCPLCRSPVEAVPEIPVVVAISAAESESIEPGSSSSGFCAECDRADRMALSHPSSSAGSRSFRARRKPAEVSIEIPRRGDGEFAAASPSTTPLTPSFKSPISRVMSLSFKRIIGRDRRGGASPSGNAGGCSSVAGAESDIERGKDCAV